MTSTLLVRLLRGLVSLASELDEGRVTLCGTTRDFSTDSWPLAEVIRLDCAPARTALCI